MTPPLDSRSDQPPGPWSAPQSPPPTGAGTPSPPPPAWPPAPSGSAGVPWSPAPPLGPPSRLRPGGRPLEPDPGGSGELPPQPPPPPDRFARTAPASPRPPARPSPWGWRALAAFVAGGLLVGTGFGVAQLTDDEARTATVTRPSPFGQTSTVPPGTAPQPGVEPVADVARILGPAVVQIETGVGLGSGVIYSADGYILTNNHVVAGSSKVQVRLADGSRLGGEVLGVDPVVDIAVVKVAPDEPLPVAELALGVPVQVGQLAVAIGSPFELQQTVTSGIVSAVNRPVPNGNTFVAMIQTDAPINPGNSGGALGDRQGRVIGINTSIRTETGTNAGIGFAVPIDTAMDTAQRIINGEPLDQAFLGVGGDEVPTGESGVLVTQVTPGSAAEAAGVQVGDRITAFDGEPVTNLYGLSALVRARRPGEPVVLELVREDQELVLEVELGTLASTGD